MKKIYDATVGINNIFARLNVAYAKYITEIRKQITALEGKGNLSKDQQTQLRDLEKDMREIKMQQAIVTSIKTLLTNNYQVTERDPTFFAEDNAGQKVPLKDMTQQYVRKLLNTFNELHSNPSVYRILFQVNAPLNIADIFFTTGINLYETGNQGKENSREVSELIGRIELILHNHGLYSRPANVSPMVPMIADEFASYYYADIGQVFNEIRKNNGPYIIATQTGSAQLVAKFGWEFFLSLMSGLRNMFMFGDGIEEDAKVMSYKMGTHTEFTMGPRDMYPPKVVKNMEPEQIRTLESFITAVAYNDDNNPTSDIISHPDPSMENIGLKAAIANADKFDDTKGSDDMKALDEILADAKERQIKQDYSSYELHLMDLLVGMTQDEADVIEKTTDKDAEAALNEAKAKCNQNDGAEDSKDMMRGMLSALGDNDQDRDNPLEATYARDYEDTVNDDDLADLTNDLLATEGVVPGQERVSGIYWPSKTL